MARNDSLDPSDQLIWTAGKTILAAVTAIYEQYRESVERQHKDVMAWQISGGHAQG